MKIPVRFWRTSSITTRIRELLVEQQGLTRQLYSPDLDPLGRAAIDLRERELIVHLSELRSERSRRARALAAAVGMVPNKGKP